jgi:hypothetical protein
MESEIKLVDLRRETLATVREAIKIASSMGAGGFKFYVDKNFVKNGLVITKIVPLSTDVPPPSQLMLNFAGLKNLKKTLDFAKKILGDAGEVEVVERTPAPIEVAAPVEKATEPEVTEAPAEEAPIAEEPATEPAKKKGRKKATAILDATAEAHTEEEGE